MKSYFAVYRQAQSAKDIESTVLVFDKNLNIGFKDENNYNQMINWLIKDVRANFDLAQQQSVLRYTDGSHLYIEGKDAAESVNQIHEEAAQPWFKRSSGKEWIRNSFLVLLIISAILALYFLLVPWFSQLMASKVSIRTEKQLGDAVFNALQLKSQEDGAKTVVLNEFFRAMHVESPYDIRISVIKGEITNAFALPGGRIVVYTGILDKIKSYPELAALLSHEFTHINNKHTTKSLFRRLGSKVFLGLLFGRVSAVTGVVVDNADNLRSLKYSRRLEKEADIEGLNLLLKRQIDPAGFEQLFIHLKDSAPTNALPEFLGSHPDVNKRIRYINEASGMPLIKEHTELKTIFEKLNNWQ